MENSEYHSVASASLQGWERSWLWGGERVATPGTKKRSLYARLLTHEPTSKSVHPWLVQVKMVLHSKLYFCLKRRHTLYLYKARNLLLLLV